MKYELNLMIDDFKKLPVDDNEYITVSQNNQWYDTLCRIYLDEESKNEFWEEAGSAGLLMLKAPDNHVEVLMKDGRPQGYLAGSPAQDGSAIFQFLVLSYGKNKSDYDQSETGL